LWSNVEIIGWLYQFYISEKKDEVIGKIVTSEDIPAATQLFTPNWIVKYLVQNTLGKQWLATHPDSNLRNKMEYYIPSTNPENMEMKQVEELTFLDPACGSGHILVEAYHLFKEIYLECGYRKSEIPELILSKNLFGIEIDDRAAQLAAFALMMKAAADDKTILTKKNITPNIITINETNHLDAKLVTQHLNEPNLKTNRAPLPHKKFATIELDEKPLINPKTLVKDKINLADINLLVDLFKNAKTFGTLIRIPKTLPAILETIKNRTEIIEQYGDMNDQEIIAQLKPLIKQTETLAQKFDLVVANPPYMGNKYLNQTLKKFATENYPDTKADLFAMFIERGLEMIFDNGLCGIITMQSWMFLSSFENLRSKLLDKKTIVSLAHFGARAFDTISGDVVSTTAFVLQNKNHVDYKGTYLRLVEGNSETEKIRAIKEVIQNPDCGWLFRASAADFKKIPGSPIAYWVSEKIVKAFENGKPLGEIADVRLGLITSDDERFLRRWYEVSLQRIKFDATTREEVKNSSIKWFPLNKGGDFKKWYGNQEYLVNWENDGNEIRNFMGNNGRLRSRPQNMEYFFKESIGWSLISSVIPAFRFFPSGFIFNAVGPSMFIGEKTMQQKILGFCNTKIATAILKFLNPTVSFPVGSIALLPLILDVESPVVSRLIEIAKQDWDDFETSWDFSENPLVRLSCEMDTES
jgi:16S rRNA G966 N2-methylase RsmD